MTVEQEKLVDLVERSRQGDRNAQDDLVRLVQNRVYYHCKKMMKKEEDAQDATQDVLITMLIGLDKLREPAAFWGWVNGITANRCKHLLSAPHKEWQIPEDEEDNSVLDDLENMDETLVPEKALDDQETRRMILGLVDDLPPDQRLSVLFYYYDEMSVREIAQAMDTSEGTVKSRLNYARKSIKKGVEDYERKGVKLYSVSPILLLVCFLRQEAGAAALEGASAAAMADRVLAQAGGAAETAGAAAAGISTRLIACVLAGAVAIGGAAVGVTTLMGQGGQEEQPAPAADVSVQEDGSFAQAHGFAIVEPQAYEGLPVTLLLGNSGLTSLPSANSLTPPVITVTAPDEEGYVTYTAVYTVAVQSHIGSAGNAALSLSILVQDYCLYDYYTGRIYFPDERVDTAGEARAVGTSEVEHGGERFPIYYEKRWQSGMEYGDWVASDQPGVDREIQVDLYQAVTYTVRVPEGYDGVLMGLNVIDPADPNRTIPEEWDLEVDDPAHYRFIRLSSQG